MKTIMKMLAIANETNRSGKRDGDYFLSEAQRAAKFWDGVLGHSTVVIKIGSFSASPARLRDGVALACDLVSDAEAVAVFCHGTQASLPGAGYKIANIGKLCEVLPATCKKIILYACSCGKGGRGSFAHALAEASGRVVIAHTTAGDTTRNPNVISFIPNDDPIDMRLFFYENAAYGFRAAWNRYCAEMRSVHSNLRYRLPFISWWEILNAFDLGNAPADSDFANIKLLRD